MSLIDKIRADSIDARKKGDKLAGALLTTLFAEAARVGKDAGNRASTDEEVVKTVRKFLKNAEETLAVGRADAKDKTLNEIRILNGYLPQEMSAEELKAAIETIVAGLADRSPKAMGQVMAALKAAHGATYDGKLASQLVKESLSSQG